MEGYMELFHQFSPVLYLAMLVIGFFIVRTLKQVDANQKALFDWIKDIEGKVNHILGEHDAIMRWGGHRNHESWDKNQ